MFSWFLSYFTEEYENKTDIKFYLQVSLGIIGAMVLSKALRSYFTFSSCLTLSRSLALRMLSSMTHASLAKFFDRVPIGRILNRFLSDTETVDLEMAYVMDKLVFVAFNFLLDLGVALFTAGPLMIPLVLVYCYLAFSLQRYDMNLMREVTRLKAISASDIIQHFSESMLGCKTIRAFDARESMAAEFMARLDENQKYCILLIAAKYWFSSRIQYLSQIVLVPAIIISVSCCYVDADC